MRRLEGVKFVRSGQNKTNRNKNIQISNFIIVVDFEQKTHK